jgi:hypothetical protein
MRRCSISARASGLVNSRSGSRMLNGSLLPFVAGLVLGRQRQRNVGAGVGVFAEVLDRLADAVAGARIRQRQRKLRRVEQRPRLGGLLGPRPGRLFGRLLGSVTGKHGVRFGDAVVVLDLVGHLQRAAGLAFRILCQRYGRRTVGQR